MKCVTRALVAIGLAAPFVGGCQFYSVQDADTGKSGYVTLNWTKKKYGETGTRFRDWKTWEDVKLTNTVVEPIPADEAWAELAAADSKR